MSRDTIAQINLAALSHNLKRVRELAAGSRVMAVVKADAYGHGLVRVARALTAADMFAVATLEEALTLRRAGLAHPILMLEGFHGRDQLPAIQQHGLEVVVHSETQLRALEQEPQLQIRRAWLKLDSGMHRLGFPTEQAAQQHARLCRLKGIQEVALMSHFACADEIDHPLNQLQIQRFDAAVAGLAGVQSFANSAALVNFPEARRDWVRSGLMLYGVSPFTDRTAADLGLRPVMTLGTRILAVHQVEAGESIGYGAAFRCPEAMPVGIAAIGYGDGYPRHANNGTPVLVNGQRAHLVGRVSMDMLAIDLRGLAPVQVGDPVCLWGEGLPLETVAPHADAIPYQLLCGITNRVEIRIAAETVAARQRVTQNDPLSAESAK